MSDAKHNKSGQSNNKHQDEERAILLLGGKGAGKSSIILKFLDRMQDTPNPTVALEYTYGRKPHANDLGKDIVHLWELAGGVSLAELVENIITTQALRSLSCVIAVDLSKPDELLTTLTVLTETARKRIDRILSELITKGSRLPEYLRQKAWERVNEEHPDKELLDPFPIPLVIVGTKYDLFQKMDPEHRKIICKLMRFIAHTNGATLMFISTQDEKLMQRSKSMMSNLAFRSRVGFQEEFDQNKPLMVSPGSDSLQQIGAPPVPLDSRNKLGAKKPIDLWQAAYDNYFPAKNDMLRKETENPCIDPKYAEPEIDSKRKEKDAVLEKYRIHSEKRARDLAAKHASSARRAAPPSANTPSGSRRTARRRPQASS